MSMKTRDKIGRQAAEKYDRAARDFAKTDKGERAAEEAKRALDSDEAEELRRAERIGKAPKEGRPG
jgi:hypothetical protein